MRWMRKAVQILLFLVGVALGRLLFQLLLSNVFNDRRHPCQRPTGAGAGGGEGEGRRAESWDRDNLKLLPAPVDDTVVIGVMTTQANLRTRARAIFSTWARDIPGVVVFYTGETDTQRPGGDSRPASNDDDNSNAGGDKNEDDIKINSKSERGDAIDGGKDDNTNSDKNNNINNNNNNNSHTTFIPESVREAPVQILHGLPVVVLPGVSDTDYPPRAKSFAMLTHMLHNFGPRFRWFVRADDDVYIRHGALVKFLLSINSNLRPLYLGQPGVGTVLEKGRLGLSRGRPYCMGGSGVVLNLKALRLLVPHLPACAKHAVTSHEDTELGRCMWSYLKVSCSDNRRVRALFRHDYKEAAVSRMWQMVNAPSVLTLHPVKTAGLMQKLHLLAASKGLQGMQHRQQRLSLQLRSMAVRQSLLEQRPDLGHFLQRFDVGQHNGNHAHRPAFGGALANLLLLKRWLAQRDSPPHTDLSPPEFATSDDIQAWSRAILKKTHYSFTFPEPLYRKSVALDANSKLMDFVLKYNEVILSNKDILANYQRFSSVRGIEHLITIAARPRKQQSYLLTSNFEPLELREWELEDSQPKVDTGNINISRDVTSEGVMKTEDHQNIQAPPWPALHVLMSLSGRSAIFQRFLKQMSEAVKLYAGKVHLRVALYSDAEGEKEVNLETVRQNQELNITVVAMEGEFSRGPSLAALSKGMEDNATLVFMDVDLVFTEQFLYRVAKNVQLGTAYYPICFSQFSPETVCYGVPGCRVDTFDFSQSSGLWRSYGFGIMAVKTVDLNRAGGWSLTIKGWGKEDVDLLDRYLAYGFQ